MTHGNPEKFYGKYRGTVVSNIDPEFLGRLIVQVPDVMGLGSSSWAMPCVPCTGANLEYSVPSIGAFVWVEYEQGNPDYPIWVGCFSGP